MDKQELIARTRDFSLAIVRLWQMLPHRTDATVLGKQLLRCATSVGANYRATVHARSKADFWAKLKICEEEADESEYWLELMEAAGIVPAQQLAPLRREAHELSCIMSAAARTIRDSLDKSSIPHELRSLKFQNRNS